jgi:hypothetical protein
MKTSLSLVLSACATSLAGLILSAIPWDVAPYMSATINPGAQSTNESIRFSKSLTITDLDTYKNTETEALFTVPGNMMEIVISLDSGDESSLIQTRTSTNPNTGQEVWTISHVADDVEGTGQMTYVDTYEVNDKGKPPVKDQSATVQQQVTVQGL